MTGSTGDERTTAAARITRTIAELGDWRGDTLARMRKLILECDPEMIEEMEPLAIPNAVLPGRSIAPKVDCAAKDALEALNQPTVMGTVLRQVEFLKDLGCGPKEDRSVVLPHC